MKADHHDPLASLIFDEAKASIEIIDQTQLPHKLVMKHLTTVEDCCEAISDMWVRGAPLIGVTAAFGFAFGLKEHSSELYQDELMARLLSTRPTAVNLHWALERMRSSLKGVSSDNRYAVALEEANSILKEDSRLCEQIGEHGFEVFKAIADEKHCDSGQPLQVMTHCNAGWLATAGWGTALAPIYKAHLAGLPVHVWVSETRPRNQGAALTAWELGQAGVPHTVIADNVAGHLMQLGKVDVCIVGSDRTASNGDVCNKIGTYLKALAAQANSVPFYAALPTSTIDWSIADGVAEIPIEERCGSELEIVSGIDEQGNIQNVRVLPKNTQVLNAAFDVTPAALVTGVITEYGVYQPNELQTLQSELSAKE